jgi:hypothetical protein
VSLPPPSPAGFGIRAGARIVDIIVGSMVGFVGGVMGTLILRVAAPESLGHLPPLSGPSLLLSSLGSLA